MILSFSFTAGVKNLIFHDEITKVQEEVTKLTDQGINKIIVAGNGGFEFDKQLAAAVEGVDIVVGGHTDTFLYTGKSIPVESLCDARAFLFYEQNA